MKGMKGKLLKKLKTIRTIGYLKPDRVLQVNASDGFFYNSQTNSNSEVQEEDLKKPIQNQTSLRVQDPEIIDVSDLMRDLEDEEIDDKENIRPETEDKDSKNEFLSDPNKENLEEAPLSKSDDVLSFRRPDVNSGTLFDPNLLAAFEKAVMEVKAQEAERRSRIEQSIEEKIGEEEEEPPLKSRKIDPLLDFEEKCPPGGGNSVILYTTGIRGIRKTFEDCKSVRFLLKSFRVLVQERDVSMHSEFREEMWRTLDGEKLAPPRIFIKGRYIGGAEEVLTLHEQGKLGQLLDGMPRIDPSVGPCEGCAGLRFVVCFRCNGSHKIVGVDVDDGVWMECPDCNENGLIVCPICC